MKSIALGLVSLCLLIVLAACGGAEGESIARVTALPENLATATPRPTLTPSPSPQPLEGMAALVATSDAATAQAVVTATPMPLDKNLPQGSARDLALATDTALVPTPRIALTFDESPVPITFEEFYDGFDIRTGLILSDKLVSLDGQNVVMEGYMAPPLKAEIDFFVLTRIRLAFCPFCSTAADWPDDIALVYMPPDQTTTALDKPIRIQGRLDVGLSVDSETGMVSLVRLYAEELEIIQ